MNGKMEKIQSLAHATAEYAKVALTVTEVSTQRPGTFAKRNQKFEIGQH